MEPIDMTGQPRSDGEIEEAIKQIEETIVKGFLKVPPNLAIHLMTIRDALTELLERRRGGD